MFSTDHQNPTKTENTSTDLAEIIREETDDGRLLVRVLTDIAEGKIEDTKPHHRIAAIKELHRQRRENTPGHSCGCCDKNATLPAASTTGEEFDMPPEDAAGPDQPSEFAHDPESDPDQPTDNTDSAIPEPEQSREDADTAEPGPGLTLKNPYLAGPPSRRSRLTRRERRRLKRKSTKIPGPLDNVPSDTRFEVDSVVSAGFR